MPRGVSLLHYLDARFTSVETEIAERARLLQEEIDRRMEAQNRAIDKAQSEMNRRLEGMNEFRDAMRDQAGQMLTKDSFAAQIGGEKDRADGVHDLLAARIDRLEKTLDEFAGAAGQRTERRLSVSAVVAIISVILVAAGLAVTIIIATRPHG